MAQDLFNKTFIFSYGKVDTDKDLSPSQHECTFPEEATRSTFDKELCERWQAAMRAGKFRNTVEGVQTRTLPGKKGYVLLLNMERITSRRAPQHITQVCQPFNPKAFNFTRVPQDEVLLKLQARDYPQSEHPDVTMINASPMSYGHMLLVPQVSACQPQILTERAIKLTLDMMLLSRTRAFRAGFNSLCAFSSVNHLHVHGYYSQDKLYVETMPGEAVAPGLFYLSGSSCPGYGLQLTSPALVGSLARQVYLIVEYLQRKNIAHNLSFTRGAPFESGPDIPDDVVRVFVWPRKSVTACSDNGGSLMDLPINVACAELGSVIVVKDAESYEALTEEDVDGLIAKHALSPEQYFDIQKDIIDLLSSTN